MRFPLLVAWDTYEFETSCSYSHILPPCISNYAPPIRYACYWSDHESTSYPITFLMIAFLGSLV